MISSIDEGIQPIAYLDGLIATINSALQLTCSSQTERCIAFKTISSAASDAKTTVVNLSGQDLTSVTAENF